MKIEIFKKGKQFYFRIKAKNGKILAHSEKYHRINDAIKAVKLIMGCADWTLEHLT